jgi:hypothetical protein
VRVSEAACTALASVDPLDMLGLVGRSSFQGGYLMYERASVRCWCDGDATLVPWNVSDRYFGETGDEADGFGGAWTTTQIGVWTRRDERAVASRTKQDAEVAWISGERERLPQALTGGSARPFAPRKVAAGSQAAVAKRISLR